MTHRITNLAAAVLLTSAGIFFSGCTSSKMDGHTDLLEDKQYTTIDFRLEDSSKVESESPEINHWLEFSIFPVEIRIPLPRVSK